MTLRIRALSKPFPARVIVSSRRSIPSTVLRTPFLPRKVFLRRVLESPSKSVCASIRNSLPRGLPSFPEKGKCRARGAVDRFQSSFLRDCFWFLAALFHRLPRPSSQRAAHDAHHQRRRNR